MSDLRPYSCFDDGLWIIVLLIILFCCCGGFGLGFGSFCGFGPFAPIFCCCC
ncbi:hypothetical protein [Clostridium colicanis]|uniref:hypothetical protein n=1 Tax=Clostridium colicanis TaxID=179628 RepID=UPI00147023EA|nr:hypothetical protein [Clostridium colicanis]